jgi:hypothetical protein
VLLPFGVYVLVAVVVEELVVVVVTETEDGADVEAAALVEVWVSEARVPVRLYIAAH